MRRLLIALVLLSSCHKSEQKCLKIAATPTPHAEILEVIRPDLKARGIDLKIIEVEDYAIPNRLLVENQVDANFFQHRPFMEDQKRRFGYKIEELAAVHIEPLGLYSDKIHSLQEITEGSSATIPSDPTNEARALMLLDHLGILKLKAAGYDITVHDIENNPLKLKIKEIDAPFLPRTLKDVTFSVIPVNYVLQAGMDPSTAIACEDEASAYVNIVAIREGDNREELYVLKEELSSPKLESYRLYGMKKPPQK